MRHKLLAAASAAALLPFAVAATPLVDVVAVRYEGIVSGVHPLHGGRGADCLCGYEVGEPISGTLLVDPRTLPPDLAPFRPDLGDYFIEPPFLGPSFVVGRAPVRAVSRDRLTISDGVQGVDDFRIVDSESGVSADALGRERFELDSVQLHASSSRRDFLGGDSVFQSFTLAGADVGEGRIEIRREIADAPKSAIGGAIDFVLKRLSVKPDRCAI
jgi:hypothetical protein